MAFTNFCCRSGGSNLNAGTLTGNTTEPGTGASFTYASGSWVQSTGVFTVASGDPASDGVAVGDFASVYADGSTVTGFVGRITARDATTITVSSTAKAGTKPTDGSSNRTLKVGGAWAGPNGAVNFPFGFIQNTLTNVGANHTRINLKNAATYSVTAAVAHANAGPITWQGYTSAYGDLGKWILDGGTSGASYALLTVSGAGNFLLDYIVQNNGATGSANGLTISSNRSFFARGVANSIRGNGIIVTGSWNMMAEVEAYACNQGNAGNVGGFSLQGNYFRGVRLIAHDNAGSNNSGIFATDGMYCVLLNCISESNGRDGLYSQDGSSNWFLSHCDFYNNGRDGVRFDSAAGNYPFFVENSNFVKNAGYGLHVVTATGGTVGILSKCGFGAGTQANTSGQTNNLGDSVDVSSSVTFADDVTPWVDPANGDFRISLAAAINAGRGTFTQTAASYAGAIGYPDIGAVQHLESAGGSGGGLKLAGRGGLAG